MKRGDIYIQATVYRTGPNEDGACRIRFDQYALRSVRKGIAFLTVQNEWTWVKTGFGKRATWGWAASIPAYYRHSFPVSEGALKGYCRTESAAVKAAMRSLRRQHKYWSGKCHDSVVRINEEIACLSRWMDRATPGDRP